MRTNKLFNGEGYHHDYNIERGMRTLSMESEFISNVISTFRELIPAVTFKIKEILSTFSSDPVNSHSFIYEKKHKELKDKIKHINYTLYAKTLVSTPEGFKGSFLEYAICLNRVLPSLFSSTNELLAEYNFILSGFITNKENKISLKDHTTLYKQASHLRESVLKEIDKFFTGNDSSKKYLGGVIDRFSDLDNIVLEVKKLEKFHNQQNMDQVRDSIKKSVDLLDIIIKDVQSSDISNVSGSAAKNISEGAMEIAKLIEMLSIVRFRTNQFITSIDALFDTVEKIS